MDYGKYHKYIKELPDGVFGRLIGTLEVIESYELCAMLKHEAELRGIDFKAY